MSAVLLDEKRPTARKPQRCNACLGTIAVGDQYLRQSVADNGTVGTWKAHALCDAAYWIAHREAGLWEDEEVSPEEVQDVIERFFVAISAAPAASGPKEDDHG